MGDRVRFRTSLVCWVAARSLTSDRGETGVRVLVGVVAVLVALFGAAMYPTAQARSQHTAENLVPVAAPDTRSSGVRVDQREDFFEGEPVQVRTFARVGAPTDAASDEGAYPVPAEGEQVVSPRMRSLLGSSDVLAERYPGAVAGAVPDDRLNGPRDLVVWRTVPASELPTDAGWLDPGSPRTAGDVAGSVPTELRYASNMLVVGFLVPLLALLVVIGTLGAARREQRLAAMRLVGMTDREARASAAVAAALTSALSALVGWALFVLLTPVAAPALPVEDGVWPDDVRLPVLSLVAVLVVFPVLSVVANWWGLRSLVTSPLGVERRTHAPRSRRWPSVLFVGGAVLLGVIATDVLDDRVLRSRLALLATALLMLGLVGVVPLVARAVATRLAERGRGLSTLVGARQITADPARATRSSVGLALLVCAAGPMLVFFPLIADGAARDLDQLGGLVGEGTILATTSPADDPVAAAPLRRAGTDRLAASPYLDGSVTIDVVPLAEVGRTDGGMTVGFVHCADLERVTGISAAECGRGLRLPGTGDEQVRGTWTAYEEVQVGEEGRVEQRPVGRPVTIDLRPVETPDLASLYDGVSVSTQVLLPDAVAGDAVPREGYTRLTLARPRPGQLERARTDVTAVTDGDVLTVDEMYAVATRTTRDFRAITAGAGLLVVLVAALTTVVTAFEQVQRSRPERLLLLISGAEPSLLRRALLVQTLVPSLIALAPAVLISCGLTYELVSLLETPRTPVPVTEIVTVAALALVVTTVAGQLVARLAPAQTITRTE